MFLFSKDFEQSLRSSSTPTSSILPAMPAKPGAGLNPEFHRGCTGKAHACGTMKNQSARSNSSARNTASSASNNPNSPCPFGNPGKQQATVSATRRWNSGSEMMYVEDGTDNNTNDDNRTTALVGNGTNGSPRLAVGGTSSISHRSKPTPISTASSSSSSLSSFHKENRGHASTSHCGGWGNGKGGGGSNHSNHLMVQKTTATSGKCGRNKLRQHQQQPINVSTVKRPPWKYCSAGGGVVGGGSSPVIPGHIMTPAIASAPPPPSASAHLTCLPMQNQCAVRGRGAGASSSIAQRRIQHDGAGSVQWHTLWERSLLCNRGGISSSNISASSYKNYDEFICKQKVQLSFTLHTLFGNGKPAFLLARSDDRCLGSSPS